MLLSCRDPYYGDLGSPSDKIEAILKEYKNNNFYLTDLSCCDDECIC